MRTIFWTCVALLVERWIEKHESRCLRFSIVLGVPDPHRDIIEPSALLWGTGRHPGPTYSHVWEPVQDKERLQPGEITFVDDTGDVIGVFRYPGRIGDKVITHGGVVDAAAHCDEGC